MANVNALMGNNLDTMQQQQMLAESLRGQQAAGDYLSLTSLAPLQQMGQRINKGADVSAASVGGLNKARALADAKVGAATTKAGVDANAASRLNKNSVLAKTVAAGRDQDSAGLLADAKIKAADALA
ncbi:MAG: hypothetical protein IZT57_04575, partial [Chloroflexi bacterium]|nr:hypothetical protein [Chloroflexota bacterium]